MKTFHPHLRGLLRFWHTAAFVSALLAVSAMPASSQVLLEENFTFEGALTSNGWTAFSGGGTAVINATALGLTYPNLPSSGVGNAANLTASGEDLRKPLLAANTSGDLYTSFLVSVSSATTGGDYFYSLYATSGGYFGRVFARSSGAGFQVGISKNSTTVAYDTTELALGTTYLVVVKLTRNPGTGDDVAGLWVNPALGGPETAALVSSTSGGDPVTIDNVALRQGSSTPVLRVGSILVGTTWASVTPSANLPVITPSGGYAPFATFAGTASQSQNLTVGSVNLTSGISASAPTGFEVSADDTSFGPSATLPSTGGTLYARIAASVTEGEVSASITLSSAGATDVAVPVSGAVRPTSIALPYGPETFESTAFPWYTYTVQGTKSWVRSSAVGNSFMEINGYDAAPGVLPSNAWLILGPFDIPADANNLVATFNLQRAFNNLGDDSEFTFKYSSDYIGQGDPTSATWTDIPFTKPAAVLASSTVFTPSGAVSLPSTLAGQTGVYVAFQLAATSATATSRWRMDDFELFTSNLPVISVLVNPSTINEGSTATGTVSIPEAVGEDVIVTVTSADSALVLVDNGYGNPPAASSDVPIFAGETSAPFTVTTLRDFTPGSDVPVQITADGGAAYTFGQTIVTVRNIDLPAVSLTSGGYTQDFAGFVSAATLPLGWSLQGSVVDYLGDWGTGTSAGSRGNANVFGYQHTGSSGLVRQVLTLKNDTGSTIDALTISYLGRVARVDQSRSPAYSVIVNDAPEASLAYSTSSGVDLQTTSALTGLSVAPGQTITIAWTSERGLPNSGSSKQIGIGNFSVQVGAALLPPSVSSLSIPAATITRTTAEASGDVTSDGGETISAQGFVYSETSVNPNPQLGGTGVANLANSTTGVGLMSGSLSGLTPGTFYSIAAYATNAQGTTYTPVATFITASPAISFLGSYAEPFNAFDGSLPTGWSAVSSGGVQSYGGAWGTGSSAGFRGGVSDPGVLGYQHTAASGTLTVTASFINDTGAPITALYVNYLGRVARVDQTNDPAWAVSLDGNVIAELAYSTGNTSGTGGVPSDEPLSAAMTGLNIPAGAEFVIIWVSDRGTLGGTSRQIGLASFQVSTAEIPDPSISISGTLTAFTAAQGNPSVAQFFNASGTNLTSNIAVTAPTNYEVSLDNSVFFGSVTLPQVSGTVASTPVYVRIAATAPVGNPAGQVSLTSSGATTQNIAVTGTVSGGGSAYDTWASGFGLDPATTGAPTADPDGDSFNNAQEYAFGTNPTQGTGSLLSTTASGGNLVVTWLQRSDVTYNVQSTTNLATTAFANDGTVIVVDGLISPTPPAGYTRKQFTVTADGQKFYRVTGTTP